MSSRMEITQYSQELLTNNNNNTSSVQENIDLNDSESEVVSFTETYPDDRLQNNDIEDTTKLSSNGKNSREVLCISNNCKNLNSPSQITNITNNDANTVIPSPRNKNRNNEGTIFKFLIIVLINRFLINLSVKIHLSRLLIMT